MARCSGSDSSGSPDRAGPDAAEVDELDLGQHGARVRALGRARAAELAASREHLGLERRRRRAEHADRAGAVRAEDGHVARVVAHALFLLERAVVLFVDDDEPERRRPARRARSARRWRR